MAATWLASNRQQQQQQQQHLRQQQQQQKGPSLPFARTGVPPIVFLDVDGVLHPTHGETFFDSICMQYLRAIIECTGAVIVLSSAWQVTQSGRQEVDEALQRWGIPPCVARTTSSSNVGGGEERRAREIMTWVKQHSQAVASGFVVLDDLDLDSVAAPPSWEPVIPRGHFVRINDSTGLTKADAGRAIGVLGGRNPLVPPLPPPQPNAHKPVLRSESVAQDKDKALNHEVWRSDARYGGGNSN